MALGGSGTPGALASSVDLVHDRNRIGTVAYTPAAVEIQAAYPLAEAARAHQVLDTGHVRGNWF